MMNGPPGGVAEGDQQRLSSSPGVAVTPRIGDVDGQRGRFAELRYLHRDATPVGQRDERMRRATLHGPAHNLRNRAQRLRLGHGRHHNDRCLIAHGSPLITRLINAVEPNTLTLALLVPGHPATVVSGLRAGRVCCTFQAARMLSASADGEPTGALYTNNS